MKRLLLASFALFFATYSQAQITISSYSGTVAGTNDTARPINSSGFVLLKDTAATNHTWDLTSVFFDTAKIITTNTSGTSSSFPYALYYNGYTITVNGSLGIIYKTKIYRGVGSKGKISYGEHITYTHYDLSSLTGGSNDSLTYLEQDQPYVASDTALLFPCTYGTTWTNVVKKQVDYNLTIAAYSLTNATGSTVTNYYTKATTEGWGKMRFKIAAGDTTDYMDVLQVRKKSRFIDSFYVNGSPTPTVILTGLGLQQDDTSFAYEVDYYRDNEVYPLLTVTYADSNYQNPSQALVYTERLPRPSAVGTVAYSSQVRVYPNPVQDGLLHISLPNNNEDLNYDILNISGAVVMNGTIARGSTGADIQLQSSLQPGVYFLRIGQNGKVLCTKPFSIGQ